MPELTFLDPLFTAVSEGRIVRRVLAIALQIIAVLSILAGIFAAVTIVKLAFQAPGTDVTIGALLLAVFLMAAVLGAAAILTYRAGTISKLQDSTFTVIPIISVLLRTAGEVYSLLVVVVGVGGCLFMWLARADPRYWLSNFRLPGYIFFSFGSSSDTTFIGGLTLLLYSGLMSFLIVLAFYFLAESVVVVADIAQNVRLLTAAGTERKSFAAAASAESSIVPVKAVKPSCPFCGVELLPDERAAFCGSCGSRLAAH